MEIYGFTLLRNGLKYDYPFRESLNALGGFCSEIHLALGKSEDGTEEVIARDFPGIKVIPTVWDESKRKGGIILSEQTNVALEHLREAHPQGWGIYLQGDECISERDYDRIREDVRRAEESGCDAIRFRYLHFWLTYDQIAIARRWYPQEIRAIRLGSRARSTGDATTFENVTKVYESEACIYHYGHVREPSAYERKKQDFHRWWHSDEEIAKKVAKAEESDQKELCVRYLGPHPAVMAERMGRDGAPKASEVTLFGEAGVYPESFVRSIRAERVRWTRDPREVRAAGPERSVLLADWGWARHLITGGRFRSRVPRGMLSPHARPWTPEFVATLRLSEKGIGVG